VLAPPAAVQLDAGCSAAEIEMQSNSACCCTCCETAGLCCYHIVIRCHTLAALAHMASHVARKLYKAAYIVTQLQPNEWLTCCWNSCSFAAVCSLLNGRKRV
jgi:hypothetical protein